MENDKKLYNVIKENFMFYFGQGDLNLSDSEGDEVINLFCDLTQNNFDTLQKNFDISIFDYISEKFEINKDIFYHKVKNCFDDILNGKRSEFYKLFIISSKLDLDSLSLDEKNLFNVVQERSMKFLNDFEFQDDEKNLFVSMIYNLMFDKININTDTLIDVASYLNIGLIDINKIIGDYNKKIGKYTSRNALIINYLEYVYYSVLSMDISKEEIFKIARDIENDVLTINDFVYSILDIEEIYLCGDDSGSYISESFEGIIEIIYNIALMRWGEEDELIFWDRKLDEIYRSGKSVKESTKCIARQIMSTDEFNGLENYYKIFE